MAWPQVRDLLHRFCRWLNGHELSPVLPVAVPDEQGEGTTQRHAMTHARYDLRSVLLDLLAATAAVAALTTPQVGLNVVLRKS